jgi:urease accessory protein
VLSIGSSVSCCSKADRVGRDGFLRLVFERRGDRTVLTGRRFALPLQALEPSRRPDGSVYMMMLNPTGGTFGGDRLRTEVVLGAGTHAILTTPSASKIYRALDNAARSETEISIGEDAILEYLPDHLIPHPGAALRQKIAVTMAPGSCAIIYDAIAAGRVGRDERWVFREITTEISIHCGDSPWFVARSSLKPGIQPVGGPGLMDGFDYLGAIVAVGDRFGASGGNVNALDAAVCSTAGVLGGASALGSNGLVAKFLTPNADALSRTMFCGWSSARQQMIGEPGFDLRKL